jgi:tRNA (guanine-N7-)-methyltransferase
MATGGPAPHGPYVLYGRRRGHRLRPAQRKALETAGSGRSIALPEDHFLDTARLGKNWSEIWLEIGFGGGEHLADQAARHPDVLILGCEPYLNGVAKLLRKVEEAGLENVRVFGGDARSLVDALPDAAIGRLFVLFPDPWPKRRHHKRRLVSAPTFDAFARVLGSGAEFRFATDHSGYARWTLDLGLRHPEFDWPAEHAGDWRERPADAVVTRYEHKALAAGRRCIYLTFRRRQRPAPSRGLDVAPDSLHIPGKVGTG